MPLKNVGDSQAVVSLELLGSMLEALPDPALAIEGVDRILAANELARALMAREGLGKTDRLEHAFPEARALLGEDAAGRNPYGYDDAVDQEDDSASRVSSKVWSCAQAAPNPIRFDKDPRWFRPCVSTLPGEGRRLVVLRDVSEKVDADKRIEEVREVYLSAAAHKFNTPLTALKMHVHLLKAHERRRDPDSSLLAQLSQLDYHLSRLELEVNEVMDLAQLRAGELQLQPRPADFVALVKRVVDYFGSRRAEREMRFEADAAFQLARLDEPRIEQVVRQLIDNADRYSPKQSPLVIRVSGDDDSVKLEVVDQGVGIPPEARPHLFKPYFRADNVATLQLGTGLGLGLFLSQALVKLHGGEIEVQSELEQGTRATIRLPRGKKR